MLHCIPLPNHEITQTVGYPLWAVRLYVKCYCFARINTILVVLFLLIRHGAAEPVHINIIRDPLDRKVSAYYFNRLYLRHMIKMSEERRRMVNGHLCYIKILYKSPFYTRIMQQGVLNIAYAGHNVIISCKYKVYIVFFLSNVEET